VLGAPGPQPLATACAIATAIQIEHTAAFATQFSFPLAAGVQRACTRRKFEK
jgi:hypothetical protein